MQTEIIFIFTKFTQFKIVIFKSTSLKLDVDFKNLENPITKRACRPLFPVLFETPFSAGAMEHLFISSPGTMEHLELTSKNRKAFKCYDKISFIRCIALL